MARLAKQKVHENSRAQNSCGFNQYVKPRTLGNFNLDFSTFDRFQRIKSQVYDTNTRHFICQEIQLQNWLPQPRDSASLLSRPGEGSIYVFGGICQEPMTNMAKFDVGNGRSTAKYRVFTNDILVNHEKVKGVFGFGSCVYNNKLYFFFGGQGFDKIQKARSCTDQAVSFDPDTGVYEFLTLTHPQDRQLHTRRQMTSLLIDKHMLCLGGLNTHGFGLEDFLSINLETKKWQELPITNPEDGPGFVSSSAMCLVAYEERDVLTLNYLSEVHWDLVNKEIEMEGIFVFGGIKGA